MSEKPETRFRSGKVNPFLRSLKRTASFSIQQQAIHGTPDKLLCCSGIFIGLELKALGGTVTLLQAKKLEEIELAGGIAMVADPENWDEISALIRQIDEGVNYDHTKRRSGDSLNIPSSTIWRAVLAKARSNALPE